MRTIELSDEEAFFLADKVWFEKAYLDIDAMWGKLSPEGQEELKFLTDLYNKLLNKKGEE